MKSFSVCCVLVSTLLYSVQAAPQRPMGPRPGGPPPFGGPGGPPPFGGPGGPPPFGGPGGPPPFGGPGGPPPFGGPGGPPPFGGPGGPPPFGGPGGPGGPPNSCPPNDPARNKALVLTAYQEVFGDHNVANIDRYFAEDFIEHNPNDADGREALKQAILNGPLGQGPTFRVDIKRMAADGDLVWTHQKFPFMGKELATVDIFRIQCGKIQEHWDVQQDMDIGRPAANAHPFF